MLRFLFGGERGWNLWVEVGLVMGLGCLRSRASRVWLRALPELARSGVLEGLGALSRDLQFGFGVCSGLVPDW